MFYDSIVRGNIVMENKIFAGDIAIQDGTIQTISHAGTLTGARLMDFGDWLVFPGMVDTHVHCFSNPHEGFAATSAAAAAGGITTFLDMPYDMPHPITTVERFEAKIERLKKEALVDIGLWATIAKSGGTGQVIPLAEAGAAAFKLSTFETDAYRFPEIADSEMIKAMELIKESGLRAAFHAENNELIHSLIEKHIQAKKLYPKAHLETRPPVSETSAVLRVLEFAYWTGVKTHIVHVSHPRSIELIHWYQSSGMDVTAETCYPYLLLDAEALERFGPAAKINPPLRMPEDSSKLWRHQLTGNIDMITSDHAPWGIDRKRVGEQNIFLAASGMPGLEIMIPLMFDRAVVQEGVPAEKFARWMSTRPAEVFGIAGKGRIAPGFDADFTVIDPLSRWRIDQSKLHSNGKLSPFHGKEVQGKVMQTIVRGRSVYDGKQVVAEPGSGRFIAGSAYKREVVRS